MISGKRILLLASVVLAISAPSFGGVRFGGISVGVGYSYFSGQYCCYAPYDYDSFYYGPWYSPFWFTQPGPNKGTVKLSKVEKTAEVYINQAYAGVAGELKDIHLDPGAYDLEVRAPNKDPMQKRIYVLSGKTVKLEF
jgi:hypothetical protein